MIKLTKILLLSQFVQILQENCGPMKIDLCVLWAALVLNPEAVVINECICYPVVGDNFFVDHTYTRK